MNEINDGKELGDDEKWECHLCGREFASTKLPGGWLGDCHILCEYCADSVYSDSQSKFHEALSYHYIVGVIHL